MLEDMGRERMRAADTDRQQVADQLRAALDEGRLDLAEYDERLREAYAAKTYGDLDRLLADLPTSIPLMPAAPPPVRATDSSIRSAWLGHVWGPWSKAVGFFTVIWLITSVASREVVFYWPVWFLGPWGVILALRTAGGLASGEPRKYAAARVFRRQLREHKRERKALQARAIARGELPENPTKEQRRAFIAEAIERGELAPKPRAPEADKPAIQDS